MLDTIDLQLATLLQYDPVYEWRGGNAALIDSTAREVIVEGASETGKTYAACYKSYMTCREYPNTQGALVRKTSASIPGTVLVTMKRIIGNFPVNYYGGEHSPERIIYPNGSQIWIGGMDNPRKVLSGERDFIQVCQAEELSSDDWEVMTTRITGRGSVMPYTQLFGDCNPSHKRHWILQRSRTGSLKLLHTNHFDNPSLFTVDGDATKQGARTMETLDALTGVLRKRLRDGVWATAEGAVFENVIIRHIADEEIKQFDHVLHGLDWGYFPDPASYGRMHYDAARKTLHIFGEVRMWRASNEYLHQTLVEYGLTPGDMLIADSAEPKSVADFRAFGMNCRGAEKGPESVRYGIKWLQGLNEIIIDPDRAPYHAEEFVDYEYERTRDGEMISEFVDQNNHAIDDTRYATNLIWRRRGE